MVKQRQRAKNPLTEFHIESENLVFHWTIKHPIRVLSVLAGALSGISAVTITVVFRSLW